MQKRYTRNISTLSVKENESLKGCCVCVIGCGGLGGYSIEMLGRLGIGHITAVDGDVFDESNLNRQILSDTASLSQKKAEKAKARMEQVNPEVEVNAVSARLDSENAREILQGAHVVVDALDNIEIRLMLEDLCKELGIPLVHGAIGGWYAQITTILPGDKTLSRFYKGKSAKGIEKEYGNPSFTPALTAAIQVSEVVKLLIGRGELLSNKILFMDLLGQEYEIVELGNH